ncbi:hypothetical protein [Hymenobacter cavernae]|uniref:Sigma-70 family RNA polymerase sigma factor n=1 Tax=Hymenobacter cavernae TaxID=2044852 RepID=A0ABQ1TTG5_9BACT|nr:hypothetical protein [Hymenobacter cavernae]GGF03389.1 hypothetical protein GCM10011383_12970 [Hymenobacter cavernae]
MAQPLAEVLTRLRVGNQTFIINFYQQQREHFTHWAGLNHQVEPAQAHELLRAVLLEFYDQVADGRLTKLPDDLRAHLYSMAYERIAAEKNTAGLPVVEASRRQRLLELFGHLGSDCQKILMYFYFRGYNFEKVAGKMGFANATVARLQKSGCVRTLYELVSRGPGLTAPDEEAIDL